MFSKIVKYTNNTISVIPPYNQHWLSIIQDKAKLEETLGLMDYDLSKTISLEVSKNNEESKKIEDTVNLLLEKEQTIFVTGELGAGKTAWLLKIWEKLLQRTDIPIAVFVRLGKFNEIPGADFGTKLINYLFLKNKSLLSKEEITNNLHSGKFILLLDGLDEIDQKICSAELIKNYSELNNLKIITTSRPIDNKNHFFKIQPITISMLEKYFDLFGEHMIFDSLNKYGLLDICSNPLMLKLIYNDWKFTLEHPYQDTITHWDCLYDEKYPKYNNYFDNKEEELYSNRFQLLTKLIDNIIFRETEEKRKYDKEYINEIKRYYKIQAENILMPLPHKNISVFGFEPMNVISFRTSLFNGKEFMHRSIAEYFYVSALFESIEKLYPDNTITYKEERANWIPFIIKKMDISYHILTYAREYLIKKREIMESLYYDLMNYTYYILLKIYNKQNNISLEDYVDTSSSTVPRIFKRQNLKKLFSSMTIMAPEEFLFRSTYCQEFGTYFLRDLVLWIDKFKEHLTIGIEGKQYPIDQLPYGLPREIALKYPHTCWMYRSEETTQELLNAGSNREQENRELTEKSLTELIKNNEKRTILDIAISGNIQIKNKTYLLSDNTRAKYIISYLQLNPEPNKELAEILNNNVHLLEESLNQPNTIYLTLLDNINITDKFIGPKDQDIRKETVKLFKLFIQNRDEDPLTIKNNILKNINQNFKHNIKEVLDYLTSNILSPDNNPLVEELINLIKQCIFNMDYISIDSVIENTYKNK